jgi:hypothetical protein
MGYIYCLGGFIEPSKSLGGNMSQVKSLGGKNRLCSSLTCLLLAYHPIDLLALLQRNGTMELSMGYTTWPTNSMVKEER